MTKLILILITLNLNCFAQVSIDSNRKNRFDEIENGQQKIKENIHHKLIAKTEKHTKQLKLKSFKKSVKKVHIRVWTEKQCFEIYFDKNNNLKGVLTNYVVTTGSEKIKSKNKIGVAIGKSVQLDSLKTREIFNSFQKLSIDTILSMEEIPQWHYGQDGNVLIIEQLINGKYKLKFYWSPRVYSEIETAKKVANFQKNFSSEDLEQSHKLFFKTLPAGCYYYGGMTIYCKRKK